MSCRIIAIRASLSASSLSVLRLTFFHLQASSFVLQTSVLSPNSRHKSLIHPLGPHASL